MFFQGDLCRKARTPTVQTVPVSPMPAAAGPATGMSEDAATEVRETLVILKIAWFLSCQARIAHVFQRTERQTSTYLLFLVAVLVTRVSIA